MLGVVVVRSSHISVTQVRSLVFSPNSNTVYMSIKLIIPVKTSKNAVTSHLWRTDNLCHDKALFCDKKLERHEENIMDKQISSSRITCVVQLGW